MIRIRSLLVSSVLVGLVALVTATSASAFSTPLSATVRRSGSAVGTAKGTLVIGSNGWAVVGVRVTGFHTPRAHRSWKARTSIASGCTDPGFNPAVSDPADFHSVAVTAFSPWRTTRIAGTLGSLSTTDFVKECPTGQVPGSSLMLRLTIVDAANGATGGAAVLFAAG
jgi:hypothetical protein